MNVNFQLQDSSFVNPNTTTMSSSPIKFTIGFLVLFALYHAAEYFVLFAYNPAGFFAFQVLFFIVAWVLARWQGYKGLAAWGLDTQKGWVINLLMGMIVGLVLYGGTFAISTWLKSEVVVQIPSLKDIWPQLALFGLGTFFSSFSEDILTRGYLYKHLAGKASALVFALISASIYLLNHIYRLGDGAETLLYIFLLGVLFVIPVLLTKRLWFTGGMHWIGNTTFFYTHTIMNVKDGPGRLTPNTIFCFCILLFIPVVLMVIRLCRRVLIYKDNISSM